MDFLFKNHLEEKKLSSVDLYTDGASRGNPGPSGIGYCIKKNKEIIFEKGYDIGIFTNNQAEYLALIISILEIKKNFPDVKIINFYSDSLLLIKQINQEYKIKNEKLIYFNKFIKKILFDIILKPNHILRNLNKEADSLANRGIDEKRKLPEDIFNYLSNNNCI
jgi:ribonuclease HI